MPELEFSDDLHADKYRGPGESFDEWSNRHAAALKDDDDHFRQYRDLVRSQRFLPGGRVQAAAGSPRLITAFNCYVMGTISDSFTDGENSIMGTAGQAAQTMRMGGGVGYDFSTLRPKNDLIRTLGSKSSGPLGFMPIYDAVCRATASAGNRRGAQMAVLRVDHPDIEDFVRCKQNVDQLTGFNISVAVTDEFMKCVREGKLFELTFEGRGYGFVDARALWEEIMRSTYDWAEPGVIFIDQINRMNNLYYCETIAATNPCGEQPLPPYGACLLGSMNLVKFSSSIGFNFERFEEAIRIAYPAMDNVIDRTVYPLPQQRTEALDKRRMGIGITGLANALEMMGHPYGSDGFIDMTGRIMESLRDVLYEQSALRARTYGAFRKFDRTAYLDGEYVSGLKDRTRDLIAEHGIRNSHLTSVAPNGTISVCADNVSSGLEPVYKIEAERTILREGGPEQIIVQDWAYRVHGVEGRTAEECTIEDHLSVLAMVQSYVDSAVSKTINVPEGISWDDFKGIYMTAFDSGCKGCTTFNPAGKRMGIFKERVPQKVEANGDEPEVEGGACYINPENGIRTCEA